MYCEDSAGVDIDHFRPKSKFPGVTFAWHNHLLACPPCNSNYKRTRFPVTADTQTPLLIDPTAEDPEQHLILTLTDGRFVPTTAAGVFTEYVFKLNRPVLTMGRRDVWTKLRELLPRYAEFRRVGDDGRAQLLENALRNESFSAVLRAVVRISRSPGADILLPRDVLRALSDRPEVAGWI